MSCCGANHAHLEMEERERASVCVCVCVRRQERESEGRCGPSAAAGSAPPRSNPVFRWRWRCCLHPRRRCRPWCNGPRESKQRGKQRERERERKREREREDDGEREEDDGEREERRRLPRGPKTASTPDADEKIPARNGWERWAGAVVGWGCVCVRSCWLQADFA